jgi:hypothetical protein
VLLSAETVTRRCNRCGLTRSTEKDFNLSAASGRQYWCRDCQSAWYSENRARHIANVKANTIRYQQRNRRLVLDFLESHPCVDCGESDPAVLEFDHIGGKLKAISRLKLSAASARITAEIDRCEVRCVNCHLRRTALQFGWRKGREAHADEAMLQVRS